MNANAFESPLDMFVLAEGEERSLKDLEALLGFFVVCQATQHLTIGILAREWLTTTEMGTKLDYRASGKDHPEPYTEEQYNSLPYCLIRDQGYQALIMTEYMVATRQAAQDFIAGAVALARSKTYEEQTAALGMMIRDMSKLHVALPGNHGRWWQLMLDILSTDLRELRTGEPPITCSECGEVGYWEDFCPECGQNKDCPNWCIESNACDDCRQELHRKIHAAQALQGRLYVVTMIIKGRKGCVRFVCSPTEEATVNKYRLEVAICHHIGKDNARTNIKMDERGLVEMYYKGKDVPFATGATRMCTVHELAERAQRNNEPFLPGDDALTTRQFIADVHRVLADEAARRVRA